MLRRCSRVPVKTKALWIHGARTFFNIDLDSKPHVKASRKKFMSTKKRHIGKIFDKETWFSGNSKLSG